MVAPLCAQSSQPKESHRTIKFPLAVDGFCQLTPSSMVDKADYRDNLGMYGIRPAFIFILPADATNDAGHIDMPAYKEMLTFVDEVGKRLGKKADVVAFYYLERNGDPAKPPAHIAQVKLRNASLMAMELWTAKRMSSELLDLKWNMDLNSDLGAMNWMYMSGMGEIGDAGMGSKDPKLEDNLKRVEKRTPLKGAQLDIMESLARWNIGDARKKLAKAEKAAKDGEATWLAAHREIADKMEELYRKLMVEPELERRYFIEYVNMLGNLAKMLKGDEREKAVNDEINNFKKTGEYKVAVRAKPKFEELKKDYYSVRVPPGNFRESMQDYYRRRGEAFRPMKAKLNAFAREFKEVGYADRALTWVVTIELYEALGRGESGSMDKDDE